ncbi:MAG: branched-chain amino acid ABC transporter permease [Bilophila wadsworthia]
MEEFFHQLTNGLAVGGIYALIALGYTMVYGVLRLINFAHGDLFTLGSYLGLTLLFSLGLQGKMSGILVGGRSSSSMGLVAVVGYLLERVAYRPLRVQPARRRGVGPRRIHLLSNAIMLVYGARSQVYPKASCLPWRSACLAWTSRSCASSCSWARWC